MNLNHANLKPQNLWAVVSQEFARFAQEFHSNQSFTFQCRSCAQADFVAVAAGAGRVDSVDHGFNLQHSTTNYESEICFSSNTKIVALEIPVSGGSPIICCRCGRTDSALCSTCTTKRDPAFPCRDDIHLLVWSAEI